MFKKFLKNNKGFSLMELIISVAIMGVLTAVISPALLTYVEDARIQKDESAMAEISNVVKQSLDSDQDVYDEIFRIAWAVNEDAVYITMKEETEGAGYKAYCLGGPLENVAPLMERKIHGIMVEPYQSTSAKYFGLSYEICIKKEEDMVLRSVTASWVEPTDEKTNSLSRPLVGVGAESEDPINHVGKPTEDIHP